MHSPGKAHEKFMGGIAALNFVRLSSINAIPKLRIPEAQRAPLAACAAGGISLAYCILLAAAANSPSAARGSRNRGDAEFAHHAAFA